MDAFDRKLLALVQENARLTADQLGERVGLSASACHRRLKRLRDSGVIEVMQCYYVTGDADFVIILTARDMKSYERFTQRFFFDNPQVRRFHTYVVMDRAKVGLAVPLEDED
jgi:Lrp/AsnC family leucine-responsive transcriptional regulator